MKTANKTETANTTAIEAKKPKFSVAITTEAYQSLIKNTLGDPNRAKRFTAAITSAVAVNPALQECTSASILAGALLGESLNLSPSPQLGQYYLVPFKQKEKKDRNGNVISPACTTAQFILGYKGMIQLAIRTGQYKKLNVVEIKEGELVSFDPLNEEIEVKLISDYGKRETAKTIGYYAMFEYSNGFRKAIYWSKEKMLAHAGQYSKAFDVDAYKKLQEGKIPADEMWKYSSFWYKNFDDQAKKTMLRQLISHWGVMSAEFISALEGDGEARNIDLSTGEIITEAADDVIMEVVESPVEEAEQGAGIEAELTQIPGQVSLDEL